MGGRRPSLESPTACGLPSILSTGSGGARGSLFRSRQVSGSSILSDGSDPRDSPIMCPKSPGGSGEKKLELAGEQVSCAGSPLPPSAMTYMAGTPTVESLRADDEGTEGSIISPSRSEPEYAHYK